MNSFQAQLTSVAISAGRIPLPGRLQLAPDARGFSEEAGGLEENVASVTARWFTEHLHLFA